MGKISKGIAGLVIVVAAANALGYLGNAYVDPQHKWLWTGIAFIVAILVGVEERIRNK